MNIFCVVDKNGNNLYCTTDTGSAVACDDENRHEIQQWCGGRFIKRFVPLKWQKCVFIVVNSDGDIEKVFIDKKKAASYFVDNGDFLQVWKESSDELVLIDIAKTHNDFLMMY